MNHFESANRFQRHALFTFPHPEINFGDGNAGYSATTKSQTVKFGLDRLFLSKGANQDIRVTEN